MHNQERLDKLAEMVTAIRTAAEIAEGMLVHEPKGVMIHQDSFNDRWDFPLKFWIVEDPEGEWIHETFSGLEEVAQLKASRIEENSLWSFLSQCGYKCVELLVYTQVPDEEPEPALVS